jgi:hypothetical protein
MKFIVHFVEKIIIFFDIIIMNINANSIIILLLISILLLLSYQIFIKNHRNKHLLNKEDFSSDEAIQNIASLYNSDKLTVTDLIVTGTLNLMPKGIIVAWNGTSAPDGWALCNGQNNTPDLRGKFIYGYGLNRASTFGTTGGAETVTLSIDQMPSHNHSYKVELGHGWAQNDIIQSGQTNSGTSYTNSTGGGQPHENLPPYIVLAYIMKL